jgi:hypothetical protein
LKNIKSSTSRGEKLENGRRNSIKLNERSKRKNASMIIPF